jgi:hypothetical protein
VDHFGVNRKNQEQGGRWQTCRQRAHQQQLSLGWPGDGADCAGGWRSSYYSPWLFADLVVAVWSL